MENTTMTIDAMHTSRVRSVCPEAGRVVLAGTSGWTQGIAVPTSRTAIDAALVPTYVGRRFGADATHLEFRPFGEPPV